MKRLYRALALLASLAGLVSSAGGFIDSTLAVGSALEVAPVPGQPVESAAEPEGVSATGAWQAMQLLVTKLTAADGGAGDHLGASVSVDGNTAVVGAFRAEDTAGAAYVFYRNQGGVNGSIAALSTEEQWTQVARLTATDGVAGDRFGWSVSLDGDTAIVSAPAATVGRGAAYVFYRNQGGPDAWGQVAKLVAADGAQADHFGESVSISGDTAVVGAELANIGGTFDQGTAYVFYRNQDGPDAWGLVAKLTAADGGTSDWFGGSVSASGDTAVVGAENAHWPGGAGAAYVFYRNQEGPDAWGQVTKLTAADGAPDDNFGHSVSLDGDTAVVGAAYADVGGHYDQGTAYVFYRNHGGPDAWGQVDKLIAADGAQLDSFGWSASVDGDVAVVGAYEARIGWHYSQGAAYTFERDQGGPDAWGQTAKLVAPDGAIEDRFGTSVSVSGITAIAGADYADVGSNENQGAAYVFAWPSLHLNALLLAQFPGPWPGTRYVLALIRVYDGAQAPAAGVVVTGDWTLPEGQVRTRLGVTNAAGLARSLILSGQAGTHEFCVTDLVKEGYDYKPEENEVPACKSIEVGP